MRCRVCCSVLQCVAVYRSGNEAQQTVLTPVAVCCSVLQCVAVCCSGLEGGGVGKEGRCWVAAGE